MKSARPPQASDYERCVLSSMLVDPKNTVKSVIEAGVGQLFYKPEYALIFKAIEFLYEDSGEFDQVDVTEHLIKSGNLDKVGGTITIDTIAGEHKSSANLLSHLKILNEKAALRKLITTTTATRQACYDQSADPADILHNNESNLVDIKEFMIKKKMNLTGEVRE